MQLSYSLCDTVIILKFFKFLIVQITLNKVLLVGTKTQTYIGKPVVTNAAVHAVVEEQVMHELGNPSSSESKNNQKVEEDKEIEQCFFFFL